MERSLYMPISIILQQQEQEEAADDVAEDLPRGEDPVHEMVVEMERIPVPDSSPPSPSSPPPTTPAPTDTASPSHTSQQSPEHVHVSSRELAAVMDAVCALATTQASLDQRMARAEVTIAQNHAMLLRIMSHLGLPPEPCTAHSRPVYSGSLLGYASSSRISFRSTGISTTTRVRWSHSLLPFLCFYSCLQLKN